MVHRILVVDDDKQIVRLLRSYLEKTGFEVYVAFDGENALQEIHSRRPDQYDETGQWQPLSAKRRSEAIPIRANEKVVGYLSMGRACPPRRRIMSSTVSGGPRAPARERKAVRAWAWLSPRNW